MNTQFSKADMEEHYLGLAEDWQERVDQERGKTRENGWSSRELRAAEQRRIYCEAKRDACLVKAATYRLERQTMTKAQTAIRVFLVDQTGYRANQACVHYPAGVNVEAAIAETHRSYRRFIILDRKGGLVYDSLDAKQN